MTNPDAMRILSRLSDVESVDREVEVAKVCAPAQTGADGYGRASGGKNALLLGAPRVGKSEIMRKSFDRLFNLGGEVIPIFYLLRRSSLEPKVFAKVVVHR